MWGNANRHDRFSEISIYFEIVYGNDRHVETVDAYISRVLAISMRRYSATVFAARAGRQIAMAAIRQSVKLTMLMYFDAL